MAVVKMQKVALLAHKDASESLLSVLQDAGVMEIEQVEGAKAIDHTELNFRAAELQFAIDTLSDNASKETQKLCEKKVSEDDITHAMNHTDIRGIVDELHALEEKDTETQKKKLDAQQRLEIVLPWSRLSIALDTPQETEQTVRVYGTVSGIQIEELAAEVAKSLPRTEMAVCGESGPLASVCAYIWKDDIAEFELLVTRFGWTNVDLPSLSATPQQVAEDARVLIREMDMSLGESTKRRAALSIDLPKLLLCKTYLGWMDAKQGAREAMGGTESTITLLGWIPDYAFETLRKECEETVGSCALIRVKPDEGEEAPVLLKNRKIVTPFQSVTTLYGLPLYSENDPTLSLAPFFALFFGLCLTDAGYGAILAILFGAVIWKKKITREQSPLLWTLFLCGIVTFIVSIPFGGWFGLQATQVPSLFTTETEQGVKFIGQIWNLSQKEGILFLMNLSLILGLTHLFYGMFLAGQHKWVHGNKAGAFWEDFTSHLLLGAALFTAFAPADLKTLATYSLYASLVLLVWGKGNGNPWYLRPVMGLLGAINFAIGLLSNGLSYLRILALGLVTGSIAGAVNQVAVALGTLLPFWWMQIPVIVTIFLVGHLVSIALNTLGTFIHSGRLQFIEFFGQFFEGGGRNFQPLRKELS